MTSLFPSVRFGGDYNPDQWPREVWDEDVVLMQRAGVTTATVGVFSWARLEPSPGAFDFEWLDDVFARLHAGGIRVMMATATASPPPWLAALHPESLPVTASGVRLTVGSRQQYSPSSSAYREYALRLVEKLAERYGDHPALEAWHVGNEYACHVPRSYDAESTAAFRAWLEARYRTIAELNAAWGTSFWSQGYGSFDEVNAPADAPSFKNPTQVLDFDRFSSDALLALFSAERDILRAATPSIPITTNFMGFFKDADYWKWAKQMDFITDDSYPDPSDPNSYVQLAASRDLMRSLGGGKPWLLMEQTTAAVNWRPRNAVKPVGVNRLQSLQAHARGADGILYFQWRQAKAGAEKFHSAMVPHGGADTRVFREVEALGAELATLTDTLGTDVPARVAILIDWDSWHALEQDAVPTTLSYIEQLLAWYRPLLDSGVTVDFAEAGADLSAYAVVIVPVFVAATDAALAAIDDFVAGGGRAVVTFQSAVLDERLHVRLGGYLGQLQQTLGVSVEEFAPVAAGESDDLPALAISGGITSGATLWQEIVNPTTAEVVSTFSDGFAEGLPAITRNVRGAGAAWYVATLPDRDGIAALLGQVLAEAGVTGELESSAQGVEAVRRGGTLFVFNHSAVDAEVSIGGSPTVVPAHDLIIVG